MSNGCFSGKCGDVEDILNKKYLEQGSVVYVLPEVEGNNIVERNGKMVMDWKGNNPETYIDNKGVTRKFRYNN